MAVFDLQVARHLEASDGPLALDAHGACSRADARAMLRSLHDLLAATGVGRHRRAALMMRNQPGHAALAINLFAAGLCLVVVNPYQSAERLAFDLDRLDVAVLLGSVEDLCSAPVAAFVAARKVPRLLLDGMALSALDGSLRAVPGRQTDCVFDLSTSGTTGLPRRSAFSGAVVLAAAANMAAMFDEGEGGALTHTGRVPVLVPYPMTNMSGLSFLLYAATQGRSLLLLERFDVASWVDALMRYPQRVVYLPPVAIRMLLDAPLDAPLDASLFAGMVLVRTGAAPLEDAVRDDFERRFGVPVLSHYGASEFCGTVASFPLLEYRRLSAHKRGSVGRARAGSQLRVVDGRGIALPKGTRGLLQVQSDRFGPDWISTTDLASIDTEGYIFLHRRADDAINRGGFKIVPGIIVDALRKHPAVLEVAVAGVADARLGEVPVAAVVLRDGVVATGHELLEHARAQLLAYQVPRHLMIVAALPRNASYKVDRAAVRALFDGVVHSSSGKST